MKETRKFVIAAVVAWVVLVAGLIWKTHAGADHSEAQGEEMRIINISLEISDTQYLALKRSAARNAGDAKSSWTTEEEISLIAQAAVALQADEELKREEQAVKNAKITEDYIFDDTPANPGREHKVIDDPSMPRNGGFGMEVGDVEYLHLQAESKAGRLTASLGVYYGPSGREKWYNLDMSGVIDIMRAKGYSEEEYPYHVREDGVKMFGDYVMIAANTELRPKGSILETSLGVGMVVDHCAASESEYTLIDIATNW